MGTTEHKRRRRGRRQAWESRVWRLAYLLTGSAEGAAHVVERVLMARQDLVSIAEPARIDRLVALHARERAGHMRAGRRRFSLDAYAAGASARRTLDSRLVSARAAGPPGRLHELILDLDDQPRFAWILAHLERADELWMAKAMDCSRTAAGVHLASAEKALHEAASDVIKTGDVAQWIGQSTDALRRAVHAIDPGPYLDLVKAGVRERRAGRVALLIVVLALGALVAKIGLDMLTP